MIIGAGGDAAHDGLPVLIVTGLKQEARIAAGPGLTVICSSSNPVQLREMMISFDPASIRGIVSFGVAGGLNPALKSGDIVVATEIVTADERWTTEAALTENLIALPVKRRRTVSGVLAGVEEVVTGQVGKAALRATTGADAVDMESHIAARYATENGLAVRGGARDQRSCAPCAAEADDGRHQAERQCRYVEGDARDRSQSEDRSLR